MIEANIFLDDDEAEACNDGEVVITDQAFDGVVKEKGEEMNGAGKSSCHLSRIGKQSC